MAAREQVCGQFGGLSVRRDDQLPAQPRVDVPHEDPDIAGQYLRFLGIALLGLVINTATIWLLHHKFRANFYAAKLLATGVVTFWNFFMNYFFNF